MVVSCDGAVLALPDHVLVELQVLGATFLKQCTVATELNSEVSNINTWSIVFVNVE